MLNKEEDKTIEKQIWYCYKHCVPRSGKSLYKIDIWRKQQPEPWHRAFVVYNMEKTRCYAGTNPNWRAGVAAKECFSTVIWILGYKREQEDRKWEELTEIEASEITVKDRSLLLQISSLALFVLWLWERKHHSRLTELRINIYKKVSLVTLPTISEQKPECDWHEGFTFSCLEIVNAEPCTLSKLCKLSMSNQSTTLAVYQ